MNTEKLRRYYTVKVSLVVAAISVLLMFFAWLVAPGTLATALAVLAGLVMSLAVLIATLRHTVPD